MDSTGTKPKIGTAGISNATKAKYTMGKNRLSICSVQASSKTTAIEATPNPTIISDQVPSSIPRSSNPAAPVNTCLSVDNDSEGT